MFSIEERMEAKNRYFVSIASLTVAFAVCLSPVSGDTPNSQAPVFDFSWAYGLDQVVQINPQLFATHDTQFGTWSTFDSTDSLQGHDRSVTGWRYRGELNVPTSYDMTWDIVADPDPTVDATINVTNNSASVQTFAIYIPLLITGGPYGPNTIMDGSISIALSDNDGNGATLGATTGGGAEPIYQAYIDPAFAQDPGAVVRTMLSPGYSLSAGTFGVNNDNSSFVSEVGPQANNEIALKLIFTLTPNDSASVTGSFTIIPGPAGLSLFAVFGVLGKRRRRR